jgi:phage/plasmid-associated DNA primase
MNAKTVQKKIKPPVQEVPMEDDLMIAAMETQLLRSTDNISDEDYGLPDNELPPIKEGETSLSEPLNVESEDESLRRVANGNITYHLRKPDYGNQGHVAPTHAMLVDTAAQCASSGYITVGLQKTAEKPSGKMPIGKDWPNLTLKRSDANWKGDTYKDAVNIGILTGKPNGILIWDIEAAGIEVAARMVNQYGLDYNTPMVATGGGGWHLYFRFDPDVPNINHAIKLHGQKLAMDILTTGKQAVIPPSVNRESGGAYIHQHYSNKLPEAKDMPELPAWLKWFALNPALGEDADGNIAPLVQQASQHPQNGQVMADVSKEQQKHATKELLIPAIPSSHWEKHGRALWIKMGYALGNVGFTEAEIYKWVNTRCKNSKWKPTDATELSTLPVKASANQAGFAFIRDQAATYVADIQKQVDKQFPLPKTGTWAKLAKGPSYQFTLMTDSELVKFGEDGEIPPISRTTPTSSFATATDEELPDIEEELDSYNLLQQGHLGWSQLFTQRYKRDIVITDVSSGDGFMWDETTKLWTKSAGSELESLVSPFLHKLIEGIISELMSDDGVVNVPTFKKIDKLVVNTNQSKQTYEKVKGSKQGLYRPTFVNDLDQRTHLFPVQGGMVVDCRNGGIIRQRTREDHFTWESPTTLPEDWLTCDLANANRFFGDIMCRDPQAIEYLRTVVGYALMGEVKDKSFFMFYGPEGGNGKSSVVNLLELLLGDAMYPISADLVTMLKSSTVPVLCPQLIALKRKRVGNFNEISENDTLNAGMIKKITGDDSVGPCRGLYQKEPEKFKLPMTAIFTGNSRPKYSTTDAGMKKRDKTVFFDAEFVEEPDPSKPNQYAIDDEFMSYCKCEGLWEMLAWALRGAVAWYSNGRKAIQMPPAFQTRADEYHTERVEDADVISPFLEKYYKFVTDMKVDATELRLHFNEVTKSTSNPTRFGIDIKKCRAYLANSMDKKRDNGMKYIGIQRKTAEEIKLEASLAPLLNEVLEDIAKPARI